MTKDHHEKRTGGHRSFSVASLLVLLFVASLVLAVAKSIAGTGFKSIYPLGFVAAFTSLWFLAAMARRRGWPPMTALAIGLHLHPFGCWIVQQKLAEYLESLMALRYALVLVPAILVICISFLIPAAPRSWAARRQCPDRIHLRGTGLALYVMAILWILFPLDWLSPHWLYFRAPLIGKVGVYEETYVIPRDPFSISGGTAIRSVAVVGNDERTLSISSLAYVSVGLLFVSCALEMARSTTLLGSLEAAVVRMMQAPTDWLRRKIVESEKWIAREYRRPQLHSTKVEIAGGIVALALCGALTTRGLLVTSSTQAFEALAGLALVLLFTMFIGSCFINRRLSRFRIMVALLGLLVFGAWWITGSGS